MTMIICAFRRNVHTYSRVMQRESFWMQEDIRGWWAVSDRASDLVERRTDC